MGLGQGKGFHNLLIGVVVGRQAVNILQVTTMRVVSQEIAPQNEPAHFQFADPALRQARGRGGAARAGGGGSCGLRRLLARPSADEAGGPEQGTFNKGSAIEVLW